MSRGLLILLLVPGWACAGATYTVTQRDLSQPGATPIVTKYFVQNETVRTATTDAKKVDIFQGGAIYEIDNVARSALVLTQATLDQVQATQADALKQLDDAAANAPPEKRAMGEQLASMMKQAFAAQHQSIPREYELTDRSETIDGHTCQIWEERERGAKRLELCVAPVSTLPGGSEVLAGIHSLLRYYTGSVVALGANFGWADPWPDIEKMLGVPILIRQFKEGAPIAETTLTAIRPAVVPDSLFAVPANYDVHERVLR